MQTDRVLHPTKRLPDSTAFTIADLIQVFRKWLDHPMIDNTGLEGFYDLDLRVPCGPDGCTDSSWNNSLFFNALETQLGLTVEQKTLPTKMLVVDHLNRIPHSKLMLYSRCDGRAWVAILADFIVILQFP